MKGKQGSITAKAGWAKGLALLAAVLLTLLLSVAFVTGQANADEADSPSAAVEQGETIGESAEDSASDDAVSASEEEAVSSEAAESDADGENVTAEQSQGSTVDSNAQADVEAAEEASDEASVAAVQSTGSTYGVSASSTQDMYRLYNPNSGEHFYTASWVEKNSLIVAGWRYEGVGWVAPETSNTPVYRLYNKNGGEHHYTTSSAEKNMLVSVGWSYEGIGWYSDDGKTIPVYRQYNPNQFSCNHNYTTSKTENDWLVSLGWRAEGIGWYAVGEGSSDSLSSSELFWVLIQDYSRKYGASSYVEPTKNYDETVESVKHMEGFCYAELIDFNGDGINELITAYYKKNAVVQGNYRSGGYVVEVWRGNNNHNGLLERLYSGTPFGVAADWSIELAHFNGGTQIAEGYAKHGSDHCVLYGFSGGAFSLIREYQCNYRGSASSAICAINGQSVSYSAYNKAIEALDLECYWLATTATSGVPSSVRNSVSNTFDALMPDAYSPM